MTDEEAHALRVLAEGMGDLVYELARLKLALALLGAGSLLDEADAILTAQFIRALPRWGKPPGAAEGE